MSEKTDGKDQPTWIFSSIRQWLHEYTAPDDSNSVADIDKEYLKSDNVAYRYLTIKDSDIVRCDICGKQTDIESMPDMFDHVGSHDGQGAAEVDPIEIPPRHDLENVEPWEVQISDDSEPAQIEGFEGTDD